MTAAQKIKEWRHHPVQFVWDLFKVTPDDWQVEALNAFASYDEDKRRVSLQAAVGPGKTALLAWCGWHFLVCQGSKGEHPKGAAIAVTNANLADNLWVEFSKWRSRSPFLMEAFEWEKSRIYAKDHAATWFISARSWSKTADPEEQGRTLSGLHSKYVLVLIDESGEIPTAVLKAGEQTLGNCIYGKIVQAGNPTSHEGILYAAATKLKHLWHVIRVTGDPDDPQRSPRIDLEWAKQQIETHGREDPWVMSSILGQFPPSSINALLSPDEVADAMSRRLSQEAFQYSQKRIGVDVARFGDDATVLFPRQGLYADTPIVMRGARTNEIAAQLATLKMTWGSEMEFIDGSGGFGGGTIDACMQAGFTPLEVQFGGRASDPRYFNKRSEMHFLLAEWVKRGGRLPPLPELARELTTPTYTFVGGKFRLEEKDQIKRRLGHSNDYADALALTFALPDMPSNLNVDPLRANPRRKIKAEYDPFSSERMNA